jgi:hypothetical protein
MYYTSPVNRLTRSGITLAYKPLSQKPNEFLVGLRTTTNSWAYRGETMDTPLRSNELSETGTLSVASSAKPSSGRTFRVASNEWVKMSKAGDTAFNQAIQSNDPSLAPGSVVLDPQGELLERSIASSNRIGRAMTYIFPAFPKRTLLPGSTWTEKVAWEEGIDDWQIGWDADLAWKLTGFEDCAGTTCAKLNYSGTLHPHIIKPAPWTHIKVADVAFDGRLEGAALYNTRDQVLIANTQSYSGKLNIPVPNLAKIPDEERIGAYVPEEPGSVVIQVSNKFDVRQSN